MKVLGIGDRVKFWSASLFTFFEGVVTGFLNDTVEVTCKGEGEKNLLQPVLIRDNQIKEVIVGDMTTVYPYWDKTWEEAGQPQC